MDIAETRIIVRKMQDILYRILCDIDDFCKTNQIRYYLSGGTCLGAVRHHGFIPWDSDADIMLPRANYLRFLCLFAEEFKGIYYVGSLYTDQTWHLQYARICDLNSELKSKTIKESRQGVRVDVFPIDGLPEGRMSQIFYYKKLKMLCMLRNSSIREGFLPQEQYRTIKKLAAIFTRLIGPVWFAKQMDRYAAGFDYNNSKYVGASLAIHYGAREIILKEYMDKEVRVLFVDREFPIPVGFHKYLTNLYDDYAVIPEDAEKEGYTHLDRWTIHFFDQETENADRCFDVNL